MTLGHDLPDALRQMRRSPGFAAAAVLSLSLGIGANTAIFTLLDQVLLRALPVGTVITCLTTGMLFGLAPALACRRVDPGPALKQDARAVAGGQRWLRASLVIVQVSLSLILVIGAVNFCGR